jgi:hypothetical protein
MLISYAYVSNFRSLQKQVTQRSQNLVRSQAPSPNTAASAAWAKSSTFPTSQPHPGGFSNRDHIKNVWSQPDSEQIQQSGNSLMGIADDLPPSLSISMQDLKDETEKPRRSNHLDVDSPRFASVGPLRTDSSDHQAYARSKQVAPNGSDPGKTNAYGSVNHMSNGGNYAYSMSNDTSSPNMGQLGHLSPTYGGHRSIPNHVANPVSGLPGQHRGQHGVWVPLNEAGMLSPGMSGSMSGYMGIPASPGYGGAVPTQKANSKSRRCLARLKMRY